MDPRVESEADTVAEGRTQVVLVNRDYRRDAIQSSPDSLAPSSTQYYPPPTGVPHPRPRGRYSNGEREKYLPRPPSTAPVLVHCQSLLTLPTLTVYVIFATLMFCC